MLEASARQFIRYCLFNSELNSDEYFLRSLPVKKKMKLSAKPATKADLAKFKKEDDKKDKKMIKAAMKKKK
jgi:hypothetical protein